MNTNERNGENIAETQKIVFLSYRQELYEKFLRQLAGQYDIFYHRIRESAGGAAFLNETAVLYIIEMLRFTEKSAELLEFCSEPRSKKEIMAYMGFSDSKHFGNVYLKPLLSKGKIRMTLPDKPNSRNQKYVRT